MFVKYRQPSEGAFPINEALAGLVPMAVESEQVALNQDIAKNGQREAIVLWRGEVVDGRCRQKALMMLNSPIMYKELDHDLSEADVRVFVKSVNTRRNLTITQKVATAAKDWMKGNVSLKKVAKSWGISPALLDNGVWILKNHPELLEELFNGNAVQIVDSKGRQVLSSKISSVYASLKRVKEDVKEDVQYGWKVDSLIKTQAGKDWYYSVEKLVETGDAIAVKGFLVELANYKFTMNEEALAQAVS